MQCGLEIFHKTVHGDWITHGMLVHFHFNDKDGDAAWIRIQGNRPPMKTKTSFK